MALWIIFAAVTILVLGWVMYPILRPSGTDVPQDAFESAVYRDQLLELERDAERGLIDQKEKQAALNEISRRLLGVNATVETLANGPKNVAGSTTIVALASIIAVTAMTGLMYKKIGRPDLPDLPQAERVANATKTGDMPALILQVQRFLEKNPKDVRGWKVLAPALKRAGQYEKAGEAFAKIMQLDRPTPPLLVDYAETLLLANKGTPTDQVRRALKSALEIDSKFPKARFYWAMTLQRDGRRDEALQEWRTLRDQNPKNLQLQMAVQRQIAALAAAGGAADVKLPSLDRDQRQAAAAMSPKERQAMIASMVDRLAGRLKENGKDLQGWQRLIRARLVLGQKDEATKALRTARENFKNNQQALLELEQFSGALGLKNGQN